MNLVSKSVLVEILGIKFYILADADSLIITFQRSIRDYSVDCEK